MPIVTSSPPAADRTTPRPRVCPSPPRTGGTLPSPHCTERTPGTLGSQPRSRGRGAKHRGFFRRHRGSCLPATVNAHLRRPVASPPVRSHPGETVPVPPPPSERQNQQWLPTVLGGHVSPTGLGVSQAPPPPVPLCLPSPHPASGCPLPAGAHHTGPTCPPASAGDLFPAGRPRAPATMLCCAVLCPLGQSPRRTLLLSCSLTCLIPRGDIPRWCPRPRAVTSRDSASRPRAEFLLRRAGLLGSLSMQNLAPGLWGPQPQENGVALLGGTWPAPPRPPSLWGYGCLPSPAPVGP